jgi:hypothetical protein
MAMRPAPEAEPAPDVLAFDFLPLLEEPPPPALTLVANR